MAGKRRGSRVQQGRRRERRGALTAGERRQLGQLGVCLALFLTLFYTKGTQSTGLLALQAGLKEAITTDLDLTLAWTDLSWSRATGQPLTVTVAGVWSDLFRPVVRQVSPAATTYKTLLRQRVQLAPERAEERVDPLAQSGAPEKKAEEPPEEPEVIHVDYTGPALPENTSMDLYRLDVGETMAPVKGVESSGFGWREHPIAGEQKFHYGVDLAVSTGTAVQAFAAGTVDYIGESEVYGLYLQLDHGAGVKSFYAHCSQLRVQQGQQVSLGQTVALSGATGEVTGPHLHFELKKNGVRLDPSHYIDTLS